MATELTGDTKTSCEVILCLASNERPNECVPPLKKYFSISAKKFSDTIKKRKNFLKLCPTGTDPDLEKLIETYTQVETECTADALNKLTDSKNGNKRVRKLVPAYCKTLANNKYTDIKLPRNICSDKYYSASDFNSGYEHVQVSHQQYLQLKNQGEKVATRTHIIKGGKNGIDREETLYYKLIEINKKCWID